MIHELEILPEYFTAIKQGRKRFEIREKRDRDFKVSDTLHLHCGTEMIRARVTYITSYGMKPDYICMSIKRLYNRRLK